MNNLIVHEKGSILRQHIDDAGLAGGLESPLLVAVLDFRFDFVFALAFGPFLFCKKSCWKSRHTPLCVEASRFGIPRRLPVDKTGKPVIPFARFYVSGMFQYINRGFA